MELRFNEDNTFPRKQARIKITGYGGGIQTASCHILFTYAAMIIIDLSVLSEIIPCMEFTLHMIKDHTKLCISLPDSPDNL